MSGRITTNSADKVSRLANVTNGTSYREFVVTGNGMLPLYRHGDQLLVDDFSSAKCGDRVVIKDETAGLIAGVLIHMGKDQIVVAKGGQPSRGIRVPVSQSTYVGRIVWASQ